MLTTLGQDFLKPAKSGLIIYDLQRNIGDKMDQFSKGSLDQLTNYYIHQNCTSTPTYVPSTGARVICPDKTKGNFTRRQCYLMDFNRLQQAYVQD